MNYSEIISYLEKLEEIEGWYTFDFRKKNELQLDDYLEQLEFTPIENWKRIDQNKAKELLKLCLAKSLAYGTQNYINEVEVEKVIESIFNLFVSSRLSFLTNVSFDSHGVHGWTPITKSTFEAALIMEDHENISVICFEDED